ELDRVLADIEVVAFDARLSALDRAVDQPRLDRHVVLDAHALHDALDAFHRAEAPHQLVLQREVKPRRTGVALAAGAAAQLVVDSARLVPLGADDMHPAELNYLFALGLGDLARLLAGRLLLLGRGLLDLAPLLGQDLLDQAIGV